MSNYPTTLERAFDLARSGQYSSISDLKKQLMAEGLTISQLTGPSLLKQLTALIRDAAAG
jgi:hypothetical protein